MIEFGLLFLKIIWIPTLSLCLVFLYRMVQLGGQSYYGKYAGVEKRKGVFGPRLDFMSLKWEIILEGKGENPRHFVPGFDFNELSEGDIVEKLGGYLIINNQKKINLFFHCFRNYMLAWLFTIAIVLVLSAAAVFGPYLRIPHSYRTTGIE